jgi:hypothetical protein
MKSSINKRTEIEEHEKNDPNYDKCGDSFYDFIGKFCNNEAAKKLQYLNYSVLK